MVRFLNIIKLCKNNGVPWSINSGGVPVPIARSMRMSCTLLSLVHVDTHHIIDWRTIPHIRSFDHGTQYPTMTAAWRCHAILQGYTSLLQELETLLLHPVSPAKFEEKCWRGFNTKCEERRVNKASNFQRIWGPAIPTELHFQSPLHVSGTAGGPLQ